MEIYKDLSLPATKEFENLLNSQLSKTKIEEGKIIEGLVTKITDKFVFLFIEGLKSEPVLDINEIKTIDLLDKVKEGSKISVLGVCPINCIPPSTRIFPLGSKVAVCHCRSNVMEFLRVQVLESGSKISQEIPTPVPSHEPPITSTLPSLSSVEVCRERAKFRILELRSY